MTPEQRKYAIRLLAYGFHQRFPAHEGNPPDSADLLGAENALGRLETEFEITKRGVSAVTPWPTPMGS